MRDLISIVFFFFLANFKRVSSKVQTWFLLSVFSSLSGFYVKSFAASSDASADVVKQRYSLCLTHWPDKTVALQETFLNFNQAEHLQTSVLSNKY